MRIIEINVVYQSNGGDVDRSDWVAMLVHKYHLELGRNHHIQLHSQIIERLTLYLWLKAMLEMLQWVFVSSIILIYFCFLPFWISHI